MRKVNVLFTLVLVFTFSTNTVFAENTVFDFEERAKSFSQRLNDTGRNLALTSYKISDIVSTEGAAVENTHLNAKKLTIYKPIPPKKAKKKEERVYSTPRKRGIREKLHKLEKDGKLVAAKFPNATQKNIKVKNLPVRKLTIAQIRKAFFPGVPFKKLTSAQRKTVLGNYNWLLKNKVTLAVLIAIIRAEGSPSPKTVVGYLESVGYKTKSADCQRRIKKLTLEKHAKEQGLPQGCFITTVSGPSTAFGWFQIVHKTSKTLKNLELDNYSRKTQARYALELIRRNKRTADAFISLVQGGNNNRDKLDTAIKKGTKEWASGYSRLPGKKAPILEYARQELKKLQKPKSLKGRSYYQKWLDEFNDDSTD